MCSVKIPESAVSAVQSRLNRVDEDAANEEPMSPVGYHHDHEHDHESHERGLHHDNRDPFFRGDLHHNLDRDRDRLHAGGAG